MEKSYSLKSNNLKVAIEKETTACEAITNSVLEDSEDVPVNICNYVQNYMKIRYTTQTMSVMVGGP